MHGRLTIGLDATRLTRYRTGIENYVYNLLRSLPDALATTPDLRVTAFVPGGSAGVLGASVSGSDQVSLVEIGNSHPIAREQVQLPMAVLAGKEPFDLFHSTGFPAPLWARARRRLVTIHDVTFRTHPETMRLGRFYWRALVPLVVRQASGIVVDSHFIADELREHYPLVRRKPVRIVPLGVSEDWLCFTPDRTTSRSVADRYGLPMDYVAWVGALQPRKNLPFLIEVIAQVRRLRESWSDLGLVLVGAAGWKSSAIGEKIREHGLEKSVVFPGYVPDEDLRHVIASARAFAFPSRHEGFGLPTIEAMACGTPVLASSAGALPEVVGDAGLVLPLDESAWVEGLARVLGDPALAEELSRRGRARASGYTWRACAALTVDAYRATLGLA